MNLGKLFTHMPLSRSTEQYNLVRGITGGHILLGWWGNCSIFDKDVMCLTSCDDFGQVVHVRACLTKQYNLVLDKRW